MDNYIEDIGAHLKGHDVKPSYQRIKVFEYLMQNKNHPTVDMIYRALHPTIPTLSKTTVYNTLNLFVEKSLVSVIVIEENETRYDLAGKKHGHFKCNICGEIWDLFFNTDNVETSCLKKFHVEEEHFYFKGKCSACYAKTKKNN